MTVILPLVENTEFRDLPDLPEQRRAAEHRAAEYEDVVILLVPLQPHAAVVNDRRHLAALRVGDPNTFIVLLADNAFEKRRLVL